MPIELVTGKAGVPHISSADVGEQNAAIFGRENYILDGCECSINGNQVAVSAGLLMCQGRYVLIKGTGENVTFDSGQGAYRRNDLVCVRYQRSGQGIEDAQLVIVKGTPVTIASGAQAPDPQIPTASIFNDDDDVLCPIYRLRFDGIAPQQPEAVAKGNRLMVDPIVEVLIGDNAPGNAFTYHRYKSGMVEVIGSLVKSTGGMVQNVLVDPITLYKPGASNVGTVCYVQNGDPNAMSAYVTGVNVQPDGNVAILLSSPHNGAFRVNFHYIIG